MKAMCIKNGPWEPDVKCKPYGPCFGEIVTILMESPQFPDSWELLEYLFHPEGGVLSYNKRRFIPLSDLGETEIHEIKEKEQVC